MPDIDEKFSSVNIQKSRWYQLSDIVISKLEFAKIVFICKKLGARKCKHKVKHISIADQFKSTALAYDYKALNMPLISKPENWKIGGVNGEFLVYKKDLIIYNKEKSMMTQVSKEIVSNINFSQDVPYKINKKRLQEIQANFGQYLQEQG